VVLTASRNVEDVFTAIRNGASGYLIKSADPKAFQESLRQIINDGVSLSPSIARLLVEEFREKAQKMAIAGRTKAIQSLTEREREVLNSLAISGRAKDVAQELGLSHETIRVHMKNIYQKLHVNSKSEALALLANERESSRSVGA
jgi:DNA-binding NarL/FixJ family response regulator